MVINMFGVLSKIFGSHGDKVADAIYNGSDKLIYTNEEKADNAFKWAALQIKLRGVLEGYKIAQRFIALMVGIPFVSVFVVVTLVKIVLIFVSIFYMSGEGYDFAVVELDKIYDANAKTLGEPFGYICLFYFGGGALEGVTRTIVGNKSK